MTATASWDAMISSQLLHAIQNAGYHLLSSSCHRTWPPMSIVSAFLVRSEREDMIQVLSIKQCHLWIHRKYAFSVSSPVVWNSISPEYDVQKDIENLVILGLGYLMFFMDDLSSGVDFLYFCIYCFLLFKCKPPKAVW